MSPLVPLEGLKLITVSTLKMDNHRDADDKPVPDSPSATSRLNSSSGEPDGHGYM